MQRRHGHIPSTAFSTSLAVALDTTSNALFVIDTGGIRRVNADGTAEKIKVTGAGTVLLRMRLYGEMLHCARL